MKKRLTFLLLVSLLLLNCSNDSKYYGTQEDETIDRVSIEFLGKSTYIYKIDSCEYIVIDPFAIEAVGITHKADCPNPIHSK